MARDTFVGTLISRVNCGKVNPLQKTRTSVGIQWAGPLQFHSVGHGTWKGLSALGFVPVWKELQVAF